VHEKISRRRLDACVNVGAISVRWVRFEIKRDSAIYQQLQETVGEFFYFVVFVVAHEVVDGGRPRLRE
jgi:hypothetical protein